MKKIFSISSLTLLLLSGSAFASSASEYTVELVNDTVAPCPYIAPLPIQTGYHPSCNLAGSSTKTASSSRVDANGSSCADLGSSCTGECACFDNACIGELTSGVSADDSRVDYSNQLFCTAADLSVDRNDRSVVLKKNGTNFEYVFVDAANPIYDPGTGDICFSDGAGDYRIASDGQCRLDADNNGTGDDDGRLSSAGYADPTSVSLTANPTFSLVCEDGLSGCGQNGSTNAIKVGYNSPPAASGTANLTSPHSFNPNTGVENRFSLYDYSLWSLGTYLLLASDLPPGGGGPTLLGDVDFDVFDNVSDTSPLSGSDSRGRVWANTGNDEIIAKADCSYGSGKCSPGAYPVFSNLDAFRSDTATQGSLSLSLTDLQYLKNVTANGSGAPNNFTFTHPRSSNVNVDFDVNFVDDTAPVLSGTYTASELGVVDAPLPAGDIDERALRNSGTITVTIEAAQNDASKLAYLRIYPIDRDLGTVGSFFNSGQCTPQDPTYDSLNIDAGTFALISTFKDDYPTAGPATYSASFDITNRGYRYVYACAFSKSGVIAQTVFSNVGVPPINIVDNCAITGTCTTTQFSSDMRGFSFTGESVDLTVPGFTSDTYRNVAAAISGGKSTDASNVGLDKTFASNRTNQNIREFNDAIGKNIEEVVRGETPKTNHVIGSNGLEYHKPTDHSFVQWSAHESVISNTSATINHDDTNHIDISGQKTVIIEGADLYIDSNMSYADSDSVVAIVVKRDREGNGGNVYVNPQVTNLVGLFFLDGSLINAEKISSTAVNTLNVYEDDEKLGRQLLIYGSLSSSNTRGGSLWLEDDVSGVNIGGGRTVLESNEGLDSASTQLLGHCPVGSLEEINKDKSLIGKYLNCTRVQAAKYDMENFRRGFQIIEIPNLIPSDLFVDYSGCTATGSSSPNTFVSVYKDGTTTVNIGTPPVLTTVDNFIAGANLWSGQRQCLQSEPTEGNLKTTNKFFRTYLEFDSRSAKQKLDILKN